MTEDELLEFCLETYGWEPEETLSRPWAQIVELLEARASRMNRDNQSNSSGPRPLYETDGEVVQYVDDPRALGIQVIQG